MSRTTVNRVLLGLAGLLLLLGGLLVLAGGLDLYGHWHLSPPSWWPLTSPSQPVLSDASRTRWRDRGWWWPVVIGGLALLLLLALCWLAAQLRRPSPAELRLATPQTPGLALRLRGAALAEVIESAAEALPGVESARVRLLGKERRLRARALLLLEPGADVAAAVRAVHAGPLAQARAALGPDTELPLDLRIRVAAPPKAPSEHSRRRPRKPRVV